MLQLFIGIILLIFFGLFAMMAFPMKDEVAKLNQTPENNSRQSSLQDS